MCLEVPPPLSVCVQDPSLAYRATLLHPHVPSRNCDLPWITQPKLALQQFRKFFYEL